jgi:hypothetical protein
MGNVQYDFHLGQSVKVCFGNVGGETPFAPMAGKRYKVKKYFFEIKLTRPKTNYLQAPSCFRRGRKGVVKILG